MCARNKRQVLYQKKGRLQTRENFYIITKVIIVGSSVNANRSGYKNPWGQVGCGKYNTRISGFKTIWQNFPTYICSFYAAGLFRNRLSLFYV